MAIGYEDARLSFDIHERLEHEIQFIARIRDRDFTGEVLSSNFMVGDPRMLFEEMAKSWRGWDGTLVWADLEEVLRLEATSNGLGRVDLRVSMHRNLPEAKLVVTVQIDSGQLEQLAKDTRALFHSNPA